MWRKGGPDAAGLTQGKLTTLVYARHGQGCWDGAAVNKELEVL